MNVPDMLVSCIRCTATVELQATAVQKVGDAWKPVNARRPDGWIAGPVPLPEVSKGICPRCAPDWAKLQDSFLSTPPSDPEVQVKEAISVPAKKIEGIKQFIKEQPSSHIAQPAQGSAPKTSQVALMPQHMRGVTITPLSRVQHAAAAVPMARVVRSPAPTIQPRHAATATAQPLSAAAISQHVKVVAAPGVSSLVQPTKMQKIVGRAEVPAAAIAPAQAPLTNYAPVASAPYAGPTHVPDVSSEPIQKGGMVRTVMTPLPRGAGPAGGSVVHISAPEPLKK